MKKLAFLLTVTLLSSYVSDSACMRIMALDVQSFDLNKALTKFSLNQKIRERLAASAGKRRALELLQLIAHDPIIYFEFGSLRRRGLLKKEEYVPYKIITLIEKTLRWNLTHPVSVKANNISERKINLADGRMRTIVEVSFKAPPKPTIGNVGAVDVDPDFLARANITVIANVAKELINEISSMLLEDMNYNDVASNHSAESTLCDALVHAYTSKICGICNKNTGEVTEIFYTKEGRFAHKECYKLIAKPYSLLLELLRHAFSTEGSAEVRDFASDALDLLKNKLGESTLKDFCEQHGEERLCILFKEAVNTLQAQKREATRRAKDDPLRQKFSAELLVEALFGNNPNETPAQPATQTTPVSALSHDCRACSKTNCTAKCGGCKEAYYCSRGCQQKHWLGGHKTECNKKFLQKP